jgi:hypothetical protein
MLSNNTYWVGQVPHEALVISVLSPRGNPYNLRDYTEVRLRMLDGRNREVDLSGGSYNLNDLDLGRIVFTWPPKTVFKTPGDYVLQVELANDVSRDFTTVATLQVRELGRVRI